MGKRDKTYARVEGLESELLEVLLPALTACSGGRNDLIFLSDRVRPSGLPLSLRSSLANQLTELSETLIELYGQLNILPDDTAAALYLATSSQCYDLTNHHGSAPSGYASKLLKQLRGSGP
jgi:hypothetical protein